MAVRGSGRLHRAGRQAGSGGVAFYLLMLILQLNLRDDYRLPLESAPGSTHLLSTERVRNKGPGKE